MQALQRLLLDRLHAHRIDVGRTCRFEQRTGIGRRLILDSLDVLARTRTEPLVFLEGIPSYYPRLGFQRASALGFTPPSTRIPDPAFMVYPLPSWDHERQVGALVYPDAFWRADAVGLRP